ncbi:MAG TPA: ABC transporter ATP-binding protein [Candidatus Avimonoglobus intestinipullorum]|uniref:ABC transporter ATP-binding protein n=1 Tax=Candidatus Avimonoglobus intestinipullorum TaxID=2840699 RepID=A0A9D1S5U0_9FIRM|nr:ABC transporter ATP-binding protein [Candidatus Avimonoglobus intestinipullorum]
MNRKVLKWIVKNGRKSVLFIVLLTVLSIALSLLSLQFVTASRNVINIAVGQMDGVLRSACLYLVVLLLVRLFLQISINYANVHANSRFEIELKRHVFKTLINKDYLAVSQFHSGELLNRINSDVSVIVNGIVTIIPAFALFATSLVGGFWMLYSIDRFLALLILAVGPLVFLGARVYSKRYKVLHKDCQEAEGKTKSFMLEILQNILVVKSFSNENVVLDKSEELQRNNYRLKVKRTTVSVFAHVGIFLVFNAGYYFALAYCAYRLSAGQLTYGDLMAVLQLVNQIQSPFKNISGLVPRIFEVAASVERLMELEGLREESRTGRSLPKTAYEEMEALVFENVTFSYNADSVVADMNFSINKGECVVVAGESGVGKSTAMKLLLGILEPDCGSIYLKTHREKIKLGRATRELFAYVPQGNLILSGTIRENICFARADAAEAEIIQCAKIAQIWDFISSLEEGLDTVIGEKGLGLSEGQAQRISIARALLYGAPVLLLDESTSALDSQTEAALLQAVRGMTDKTCVIVSHKQAAFDICDKVVYINKQAK